MFDSSSASRPLCVLGVDPGSRITGYGIVQEGRPAPRLVAFGRVRLNTDEPLHLRISTLYHQMLELMTPQAVDHVAVEQVFVSRNAKSALQLGHARAAVLLAAVEAGLSVFEYTPAQVKKVTTGRGRAQKGQVAAMIATILGVRDRVPQDAADALAVALCHLTFMRQDAVLGRWQW